MSAAIKMKIEKQAMKIQYAILILLTAVTFINSSEASGSGIGDVSLNPLSLIESLSPNSEVQAMYSAVFNSLSGAGYDLVKLLNEFRAAGPAVIKSITARWNAPAEKLTYDQYRKIFITKERLTAGRRFHDQNRELVHAVSRKYGVDEYVLLAIVGVESMYGASHADYRIVDVYHTIAHEVPRKRAWAEQELTSFLTFCENNNLKFSDVHGSYAGAIGYAQFIPSSLLAYGRDHDGDGIINPYTWEDALESVANYLVKNHYQSKSQDFGPESQNWKAIYAYNHSSNYVNVIIELKNELKKVIE